MKGHLHPNTQLLRKSLKYFADLGFAISEGPEIETEWNNFDALNVPASHPSRDVQDTFWLKNGKLLRTQTTSSEPDIVKDKDNKPPFKIVVPGRVFRNESTDNTHNYNFYQIDGIAVDKNINLGDLIAILEGYVKFMFGGTVKTRVRPGHFDFVEPGLELDIQMPDGSWREMLGAGMGHPNVLTNLGIDPNEWQAIMWGMGIDRYTMQQFGLIDVRDIYSGDVRLIKQF